MTNERNDTMASTTTDESSIPTNLRVTGADLGSMLGISRQAVNKAVKRGTISRPGADGRFNARTAVREYFNNTDIRRSSARLFRRGVVLADDADTLRVKVRELAVEVAHLQSEIEIEREYGDKRVDAAKLRAEMETDRRLTSLFQTMRNYPTVIAAAFDDAQLWAAWTNELQGVILYRLDLQELRRESEAHIAESDDAFADELAAERRLAALLPTWTPAPLEYGPFDTPGE